MKHDSVAICYGNHGDSPSSLEDFMLLLKDAFEDAGIPVKFSIDPVPGELNVLLEHFMNDSYLKTMKKAKEINGRTEYICIGTEEVTVDTFNDYYLLRSDPITRKIRQKKRDFFHTKWGRLFLRLRKLPDPAFELIHDVLRRLPVKIWRRRSLGMNRAYDGVLDTYWHTRFLEFAQVALECKAIWCLTEDQIIGYSAAIPQVEYRTIPMAVFSSIPVVQHLPNDKKDIDFLFTGLVSTHRRALLDQLIVKGYKVVSSPACTPAFVRYQYLARAKVSLHIRGNDKWRAPSPMRLYKLLQMGAVVVAEKAEVGCMEEDFVNMASSENFIFECERQIALGRFVERGQKALIDYHKALEPRRETIRARVQEALRITNDLDGGLPVGGQSWQIEGRL